MDTGRPIKDYLNNEESLYAVMTKYYNDFFRYGVKFTADAEETKDALNQFFLHIWDNRDKLERVENFKAYLFVSYKRWLIVHLHQLRKRRLFNQDIHSNEPVESSYEEYMISQIQDEELRQILNEAINALSPRQRQLVRLRFYDQLSFDEISKRTSLTIRTVYNKLHEAIGKLRKHKLLSQIHKKVDY
jgi:RNA polymerase sigma-70 factor (ECF subfamily)